MKKVIRVIWVGIGTVIFIYAAVCIYIYFAQDKLFYYPTKGMAVDPAELGFEYEEIFLNVGESDSICVWFFPQDINYLKHKTILFCHGNAGNLSYRMETIAFLKKLGVNVLLFDYRGFWKSSGKSSELNTYEDAMACYNWLVDVKGVKPENIIIFGRSLGGAVAIELATKEDCAGLIVESSFTSAAAIGSHAFPMFPIKLLAKYKYDSINKIKDVNCPILITHSSEDDMIPFRMGQMLFEQAREPKQFFTLSGGHNQRLYFSNPEYFEAMKKLIEGNH